MRHLWLIGIGAGDERAVTVEAIEAMNSVDVFIVLDKTGGGDDLATIRHDVLRAHMRHDSHRVVHVRDTRRDSTLPYEEGVQRWHHDRVLAVEAALVEQVGEGESAGILVWGDPSVYDSTLRVVDQILDRGVLTFEHTVVPGISSIQLLAARHRITINRIGCSVLMTTGRLLKNGVPDGVDDVVVLLDASTTFVNLVGQGWEIFWGAYLGSADEILVAGPLDDVYAEIVASRSAARLRIGWIFDIYLLRRRTAGPA